MLSAKELRTVQDLIFIAEEITEECDHDANICFCSVTATVIDGYAILHSNGLGTCNFVTDYSWDSAGKLVRHLRCEQCYTEKQGV